MGDAYGLSGWNDLLKLDGGSQWGSGRCGRWTGLGHAITAEITVEGKASSFVIRERNPGVTWLLHNILLMEHFFFL